MSDVSAPYYNQDKWSNAATVLRCLQVGVYATAHSSCFSFIFPQYVGQLKVAEPRGKQIVRDAIDMVKVVPL